MVLGVQKVCWVLFSLFFANTNGANILYLAGVPSPSHGLWNFKLVEALAARGHNLTVLSVDKAKSPIKNAYILDMEEIYSLVYDTGDATLDVFVESTVFDEIFYLYDFFYKFCTVKNQTKGFQTLLAYPDNFKFDLVINDFTILGCLVGFLHKFNYPPMISVSPYKYSTSAAEVFGGHQYPGYIPRPGFPFTVEMTLSQRLENVATTLYELFYRRFIFQPKFNKLVSEMFEIKNMPCTFDLTQRAVLTLLNTHPATDYPAPLPPSVIQVGGLQISDPKSISDELELFLKKSKKGTVLISFGTNVNSGMFNEEKQKMLIGVIKKFPEYHFLWKFDIDPSEGKVPNLLVKKWLPQNDILAHPKLKAFVSHCGGLSSQEAYWHGVPIVAVPVFMDQHSNANGLLSAGVATKVEYQTMTAENLESAIRNILEDPTYADVMKLASFRFRNRPMKPLDTAVWWIEYILKDMNPAHLRSPVIDIGTIKSNCYDLMFYTFVVLVIILLGVRKLATTACRILCAKESENKIKKN